MTAKIIDGIPDLDEAMIVIVIYDKGHIMAFSEDTAIAFVFPDERSEESILDVRSRLDFIYYFAKLLDIPLKFTGLKNEEEKKDGN